MTTEALRMEDEPTAAQELQSIQLEPAFTQALSDQISREVATSTLPEGNEGTLAHDVWEAASEAKQAAWYATVGIIDAFVAQQVALAVQRCSDRRK